MTEWTHIKQVQTKWGNQNEFNGPLMKLTLDL